MCLIVPYSDHNIRIDASMLISFLMYFCGFLISSVCRIVTSLVAFESLFWKIVTSVADFIWPAVMIGNICYLIVDCDTKIVYHLDLWASLLFWCHFKENWFFIHSIHSFIPLFIHSFIHWFSHWLMHWSIDSVIQWWCCWLGIRKDGWPATPGFPLILESHE